MKEVSQFWWKMPDGSMKLVDVADFNRVMADLPNRNKGTWTPPGPARPGIGDAVARATKAVGIKPCAGCRRRQAALNRWTPAWLSRLLVRLGVLSAPPARCGECDRRKAQPAVAAATVQPGARPAAPG